MSEEFKVGDTVILKSGGPTMTITSISESGYMGGGPVHAYCTWFDGNGVKTGDFPLPAIEHS